MAKLYGGIEAGGTKFVCAVATGPDDLQDEIRFPTTTPDECIGKSIDFFKKHMPLEAVGIGSFGPVDPDPDSPTFGYVTTTPKPHWPNTDFAGPIREALGVPVGFDTDVNAAALAELRWGTGQGLHNLIYMTVGTGVGGGAIIGGKRLKGLVHPEMGHMRLPHDWERDPYPGHCPYHGDCLEGRAAGVAISDRWNTNAEKLPQDHPAWELEADILALALNNLICTQSPQRIIMGGGVMEQPQMLPMIRQKVLEYLNNYVQSSAILERIDEYIVAPGLGNRAGVLGAIALAMEAVEK